MPENNMMIDCNENESYIFISYSDKDVEMLQSIYSDLTQKGYNVLYSDYNDEKETQQKISNCTYFIALISENYISSEIYERDLQNSIDYQKDILLIFLNDDMSLFDRLPERQKWRLSSIQHLRYDNGKYCSNLPFSNEHFSACLDQNRINNADLLDSDEFGIYNGNEPYIFISYSHLDNEICDKVSECFIKEGFRIWNDRGIPSGKGWDDVIGNRLNHCDSFIGLVSRNYLHSRNCIAELKRASTSKPGADSSFLIFIEDLPFTVLPEGTQMYLNGKDQIKYSNDDWFDKIKKISLLYKSIDIIKSPFFCKIIDSLDTAEKLAAEKDFNRIKENLPVQSFYEVCLDKKYHSGGNINAILREGYRLLYLLEAYGAFSFGTSPYNEIHTKLSDTLNVLAIRHEVNEKYTDIQDRIKNLPVPDVSDIEMNISLDDVTDDSQNQDPFDDNYEPQIQFIKPTVIPKESEKDVNKDKSSNENRNTNAAAKKLSSVKLFIGIAAATVLIVIIALTVFFSSTFKMPDIMYMNQEDATVILDELGIQYNVLYTNERYDGCGYGCVFAQDPGPGSRNRNNSVVQISISLYEQEEPSEIEKIEFEEEPMRGSLFLTSDCYSTRYPMEDSELLNQYTKGSELEIVGYVNTGYYRLLDGGYIIASVLTSALPIDETETSISETESTVNPGDEIPFGNYSWIVLETDGDTALIMTSDIVDIKPYHVSEGNITWEKCSLREYLNNDFYNSFGEEKSKIVDTDLVNADNPDKNTDGGEDTTDKIFILSIEEMKKYFGAEEYDHDSNGKDDPENWVWVRNPGISNSAAMGIYSLNLVYDYDDEKDSEEYIINVDGCKVHLAVGIRPAMRIKLN